MSKEAVEYVGEEQYSCMEPSAPTSRPSIGRREGSPRRESFKGAQRKKRTAQKRRVGGRMTPGGRLSRKEGSRGKGDFRGTKKGEEV